MIDDRNKYEDRKLEDISLKTDIVNYLGLPLLKLQLLRKRKEGSDDGHDKQIAVMGR